MNPPDMSATLKSARVLILVKALPNPSQKYGETVCCAGVTVEGQWKRLFPVRFRQLKEAQFQRWDWVQFDYRRPRSDNRPESCHVYEDRLTVTNTLKRAAERAALLNPIILPSTAEAAARGQSLALIRPQAPRFRARRKPWAIVEAEREAYKKAAQQKSFLDEELAAIEPVPFEFTFTWSDADGRHTMRCGDWETTAWFWRRRHDIGEGKALEEMYGRYNEEYPKKGVVFALGTMKKRPKQWTLLGVIRLDSLTEAQQRQALLPL